jgi:hypothetical protein
LAAVGSIRFIAPIRVVHFLVDLLKCEAIYRFLFSGNLYALKKVADSMSGHDLMFQIALKTMTVGKASTREIAASAHRRCAPRQ